MSALHFSELPERDKVVPIRRSNIDEMAIDARRKVAEDLGANRKLFEAMARAERLVRSGQCTVAAAVERAVKCARAASSHPWNPEPPEAA